MSAEGRHGDPGLPGQPQRPRRPRPLVAGNWKMHLGVAEAAAYCAELRHGMEGGGAQQGPRVVLFPSYPLIPGVAQALAGSKAEVGAQDVHPAERGAHTGDVSATQLVGVGCRWTLCGHSERRRDHGETDELIARKVAAAAGHGLQPLLCVGETLAERQAGDTLEILERQVRGGLDSHPGGAVPLIVAYEPVWAIGSGQTASAEVAQEAHEFLRRTICGLMGADGGEVTLLYGGSVTPANAAALIAQPDIDGFLVGGASLDPRQFLAIIACSG